MKIKSQGKLSKYADVCMLPLMYLLQGTLREVPQQTHRWNNVKFSLQDITELQSEQLVTVPGDPSAVRRWWGPLPIFHIPLLGGWSKFVVIGSSIDQSSVWYIGWIAGDTAGLSQIALTSPVRLLVGPGSAQFFGVTDIGEQIQLKVIGHGRVGNAGDFGRLPLL